jgi:hypothetical protein
MSCLTLKSRKSFSRIKWQHSPTRVNYITVLPALPQSKFTANVTSGVAPLRVDFTNLSTGTISNFLWDFGDGNTTSDRDVSHREQSVKFKRAYKDPIVAAKSFSANGGELGVVKVSKVNQDGFTIQIQEWDHLDGTHVFEDVSYIVAEKGRYKLPTGAWLEAGEFVVDSDSAGGPVPFLSEFSVRPVVIASTNSMNGPSTSTLRLFDVGTSGFSALLQEQERNGINYLVGSASYIAIEPSIGVANGYKYKWTQSEQYYTCVAQGKFCYAIYYGSSFSC